MANSRILFVDDDERILKGILRQQDDFDITTALGPRAALEILAEEDPFAVVVSDMRMPEMNGLQLLDRIRELYPDTVRMILTGFSEIDFIVEAVNQGHVFRFLSKPCDEDVMASSLEAGLKQYALVESENELLAGTLLGTLRLMTDMLAASRPNDFGQMIRIRSIANGILEQVVVDQAWQLEVAITLRSLGDLSRIQTGNGLSCRDYSGTQIEPVSRLLRNIPRMDEVSEILVSLPPAHAESACVPRNRKAQLLQLSIEFDSLCQQNQDLMHAWTSLQSLNRPFETELLSSLEAWVHRENQTSVRVQRNERQMSAPN